MTPELSNLASSAISGGASLIGSAAAAAFNARENRRTFERQRQFAREQYDNFLRYSKVAGATPAAIAQGLTKSGGLSAPTVSVGGSPAPDFGSALASGISAGAAQRSATASNVSAYSERDINQMKLHFEPQKYFADVQKSLSEAMKNAKEAFLHGSMVKYYNELSSDLRMLRPWKVNSAKQSFMNQLREYDNLIAENGRIQSETYKNYRQGEESTSQKYLNYKLADESSQRTFNLQLEQFRKQWELDLLSIGIDVNKPFWENTARLMQTNPQLFQKRMEMFINALNILDNKIQENLGKNYKRNAAIVGGYMFFNNLHQKNANSRSYRFANFARSISSFIPFAGGSPAPVLGFANRGLY